MPSRTPFERACFHTETETEIGVSSSSVPLQSHSSAGTQPITWTTVPPPLGCCSPLFGSSKSYLPPSSFCSSLDRPQKILRISNWNQNNEEADNSFGNWKIIYKPKNNLKLCRKGDSSWHHLKHRWKDSIDITPVSLSNSADRENQKGKNWGTRQFFKISISLLFGLGFIYCRVQHLS